MKLSALSNRRPLRWVLATFLLAAAWTHAQVLTRDGSPGTYGTPYGFLGPRGTRVWENYRRGVDYQAVRHPDVFATNLPQPDQVKYSNLAMADTSNGVSYFSTGLLVGRQRGLRDYPEATVELIRTVIPTGLKPFDVRLGFAEHQAPNGGAPFNTFIANNGGDNSWMDLYSSNWGVDGAYQHLALFNDGPTWILNPRGAYLVTPGNGQEVARTSYYPQQVLISGASLLRHDAELGDLFETGISSAQPLSLHWSWTQEGGTTTLQAQLGEKVHLDWVLDNGLDRRGLTVPGNPDGSPYQNGQLDSLSFIPVMFLGLAPTEDIFHTDPVPEASMELAFSGTGPSIEGFPSRVDSGAAATFTVTAVDSRGKQDPSYAGTVHFRSTDPLALLPGDYSFTPADHGAHTFKATLSTPGAQSLEVFAAQLPTLASVQGPVQVVGDYRVGWSCAQVPRSPSWLTAVLVALAWGRRHSPRRNAAPAGAAVRES